MVATSNATSCFDQITLLVDKSLVVAESAGGATRYRMLETVRQYALEKLAESGDGDGVRGRHRDHYLKIAGLLENPAEASDEQRIERVEAEIDNLRAAFNWCLDSGDIDTALRFASALVPLWLARGRIHEALMGWFDAALSETDGHRGDVTPAVAVLARWPIGPCCTPGRSASTARTGPKRP